MQEGEGIRKSPYEEGLYFVKPEAGTTLQDHSTQWQVGSRYTLIKVLGYGSYSAVCLALDNATGERVALKRVADVLQSPDHTKRVLREICILRRLHHPNLIGIRDAFVRPSATGQCRLIRGKLVNLSVDVYIAMELADGGDLFHLRGQMSSDEVRSLVWQLLMTIKYLHSMHVWHRDMKSQNVFLVWENGERVIKIGDFGSARSAIPEGYQWAEQEAPGKKGGQRQVLHMMHTADSYQQMNEEMQPSDLYAQPEGAGPGSKTGFKAPLTRVVATPCYRAPEVVMSRGGYTAAIDMWSVGCIFGELLQRIAHVGSAATPNLQVAPLFAMHGLPKTPDDGDTFVGSPGNEMTRSELQALFNVIGTPCWADVAAVQEPSWRRYLHHLPGRAPTLYRRFSAAGEAAVDLLSRLLAFDPTRRCSPDEALAHEYFSELAPSESGSFEDNIVSPAGLHRRSMGSGMALNGGSSAALAGGRAGADEGMAQAFSAGAGPEPPETPLSTLQPYQTITVGAAAPMDVVPEAEGAAEQAAGGGAECVAAAAASAASGAAPGTSPSALAGPFAASLQVSDGAGGSGEAASRAWAAGEGPCSTPGAGAGGGAGGGERAGTPGGRRAYWEETDPGRALAMLEDELSEVTATYSTHSPEDEGSQKMRRMLEAECDAIRALSQGGQLCDLGGAGGTPGSAGGTGEPGSGSKKRARVPHKAAGAEQSILAGLLKNRGGGGGLQVDTAGEVADANRYGRERLSNVADTWQGRELDPSRILGPQRHGEWFQQQSGQGPPPGPAWGVTALPPGMDESQLDPKMLAIMRKQHGR